MKPAARLAFLLLVVFASAPGCADAPAYAVGTRAKGAPADEIAFAGMADVPARDEEAPAATSTPPPAGLAELWATAGKEAPAGDARQVIYSAAFKVVVADVPGTLRSI